MYSEPLLSKFRTEKEAILRKLKRKNSWQPGCNNTSAREVRMFISVARLVVGAFLFAYGAPAVAGCDVLKKIGKTDFFIVGYGGVGEATTHVLLKEFPGKTITVVDFLDKRDKLEPLRDRGVKFVQKKLDESNLTDTMKEHLKPGGDVIDAAWEIETEGFIKASNALKATYQNTSLEQWPWQVKEKEHRKSQDPASLTLYRRHGEIEEFIKKMGPGLRTAVIENGANPGWIAHSLRMGIRDIAIEYIKRDFPEAHTKEFQDAFASNQFNELARIMKIRVAHIAETDTQVTADRRKRGLYYNVWSIPGIFSEGNEPAEGSLGTHELPHLIPGGVKLHTSGPMNQFYMDSTGFQTYARSSTPEGLMFGNVIPHGETTDFELITRVERDGKKIFGVTSHYVYNVPKDTQRSNLEWRKKGFPPPTLEQMHYMNTDIVRGADQLGVLLLGSKVGPWWTGSRLDIDSARKVVPGGNATTLQVAAELVATLKWMKANPNAGVLYPRDLPSFEIMSDAMKYLEPWYSGPVISPVKLNPGPDGLVPDTDLQLGKFLVRPKSK